MNTSLLCVRAVVGLLCALTVGGVTHIATAREPEAKPAENPDKQAREYRVLFEKVGRAGLPDLTKDKDTSLALQASWELHKKLVKRTVFEGGKPPSYIPTDTYDVDELKKFLTFLKDRTKASVPEWWAKGISDLCVQKGKWHLNLGIGGKRKDLNPVELDGRVWHVREGVKLTRRDDVFSYKCGDVLIECPKPTKYGDLFTGGCLADVSGEKFTSLATYSSICARKFPIAGFENKSGKRLWDAEVWALAKSLHSGSSAEHRVELTTKGGTVFVFGEEFWGFYLEAFDLETGKCQFRFCSSYWGHHSEGWELNTGG